MFAQSSATLDDSFKRLKLLALNNNNGNLPVATQISLTRLVEIGAPIKKTSPDIQFKLFTVGIFQLLFFEGSPLVKFFWLWLLFFSSTSSNA